MLRPDLTLLRLLHTPGCTLNHVRVIAEITRRARHDRSDPDFGWAWPTKEQIVAGIADGGGPILSLAAVKRCLRWLDQTGLLIIERRPALRGPNGQQASNRYYVLTGLPPGYEVRRQAAESAAPSPRAKRPRRTVAADQGVASDPLVAGGQSQQAGGHFSEAGGHFSEAGGHPERPPNHPTTNYPSTNDPTLNDPRLRDAGAPRAELGTIEADGTATNGNGSAPKRQTWLTPYGDVWREAYGGEPPWGEMARTLRKPHEEFGPERNLFGFGRYCLATEARFASPTRYASTAGTWIGTVPERGTLAARNAATIASWSPPQH